MHMHLLGPGVEICEMQSSGVTLARHRTSEKATSCLEYWIGNLIGRKAVTSVGLIDATSVGGESHLRLGIE